MGVYIKGMEMPTEGMVIAIYKLDGKFYASVHGTELCPLVSVPPHGRLIDADVLIKCIPNEEIASRMAITNAPTIIEAEK